VVEDYFVLGDEYQGNILNTIGRRFCSGDGEAFLVSKFRRDIRHVITNLHQSDAMTIKQTKQSHSFIS